MKVWVVFCNSCGSHYLIEKIFTSREAAEMYVLGDRMSDLFSTADVADFPGITWYYFKEHPTYRIEEHCVED